MKRRGKVKILSFLKFRKGYRHRYKGRGSFKAFSKFERIEESRNRNIEGTGLGMNITANLLEMMGSELMVESVYGEGPALVLN